MIRWKRSRSLLIWDAALGTLTERERLVLKMLFGIGRNEMTAEEGPIVKSDA